MDMAMLRISALMVAVAGLSACAPSTPDSYQSYMRTHNSVPQGYQSTTTATAAQQGFSTEGALAAINAAQNGTGTATTTTATTAATAYPTGERPRGNAPSNIRVENGEMTAVYGNTGISNENNFEAVSSRRSIAEDAAEIAQNRAQYVTIQPEAVPQRPNNEGPNIVAYALQTNNPRGAQVYSRSSLRLSNSATQCAKYGTPDQAQEAFLASGGPERDRNNLDPDGDGYACGWDPAPFRAARG
ncbi:hypothetical protein GR316_11900 (plasmid) [Falsirhodobacter algicola]|uniref:Excalibur calcium-binding domain-containing protein n=2 Tax=Falsirhodobacter algicola TaxID=2692330 RepID=A0A8J8SLJ7_9RHOB|nr:hypothetical protein GR316_11900 [Falsirhodobacter algicola]